MRINRLDGIPNQSMGRIDSPFDQFAFDSFNEGGPIDLRVETSYGGGGGSSSFVDRPAPKTYTAPKSYEKPQKAVVLNKKEVIKIANTNAGKPVYNPINNKLKTPKPVQTMAPVITTQASVQPTNSSNTNPNNPEQPEANDKPNKTLLYGGIALAVVVVGAIALSGGETKAKAKPMGKVPAKKKPARKAPAKRTRKPVAQKPTAKKNPSGRKPVAKVTFS